MNLINKVKQIFEKEICKYCKGLGTIDIIETYYGEVIVSCSDICPKCKGKGYTV